MIPIALSGMCCCVIQHQYTCFLSQVNQLTFPARRL